ncbi:MAG: two-component regulator propeller domain-containing protein [Bryobacteraceae bacterium]
MMRFRPLLLLLASSPAFLYGLDANRTLTQYIHRIWQVQQGLPDSSIFSIYQTRDGYLWLGTQIGLVRFDGVRFTSLESVVPSMPSGLWIRDTVEDSSGALWIATNDSGLYRLSDGRVTHYSQKDGLPSDILQCLLIGPDGAVWVGTDGGLARFADGKFQVYTTANGLTTNVIRSAAFDSSGRLWVTGDRSIVSVWNGSAFETRKLVSTPPDTLVRAIAASPDGTMWIGTSNGLIALKDRKECLFTTKDGLNDNWILALAHGANDSLWIGTRSGFSRLRHGEIDSFRPEDGLSQSTVYSVFEDREGSLWVGTKHGLNQFRDGHAVPYTTNEGLPSNDAGPVLRDRQGNIWAGTIGAGLSRFDGRRFTVITGNQGLASNVINALGLGSDGSLWVGTSRGLNRLREGRVWATYTTSNGLPSNNIRALLLDRSGDLWVGTTRGAAVFRDGAFIRPPGLALTESVVSIGEDGEGRIFLATANGVAVYSGGKSKDLMQGEMPLRGVDAFYRDRGGNLWMGLLGGGLRLIQGDKISSFFMRDGLYDNEIYGFVEDEQGRLWMACSKGIFSVQRADLLRFAAGQIKKIVSFPYTPTDALRVIECKPGVQPAVATASDGRLWFSTIRGIIVLDPFRGQPNGPPPPVVIEEVTVNGETARPASIGKLAPGRKNIEFRYTGLSFSAPNWIAFRYILEGYDKDWIKAGTRREAYYTNLPPGKFRFRVTACNVDGNCNETGSSVDFTLQSHYYQRAWFFPLLALFTAILIWLAYQLRIRRLRDHFSLILTERNRIARELHDTLIQGLSGITMEMQALLGRIRAPEECGALQDIIEDAGTCLRETRRSVAGLRSGSGSGLAAAIERAARQITETQEIRLKLKLEKNPKGLPADVEYNLVRIAQEAVANSVKHSGARTVEVALDCGPRSVHLSVKDDGSGFVENGKTGHYGLIGMKERATHIGAEFALASAPGRGTTISVVLPNGHHDDRNT